MMIYWPLAYSAYCYYYYYSMRFAAPHQPIKPTADLKMVAWEVLGGSGRPSGRPEEGPDADPETDRRELNSGVAFLHPKSDLC